jgi:hypothetical protein
VLEIKNGAKVEAGDTLAEFDPTFEYVVSSSPGRIKFLNLEVTTQKKKAGGKHYEFMLAKKDGEIFVYNPKSTKEYSGPEDKVYVKEGQRIGAEEEIAQGVVSKVGGLVLKISESGKKAKIEIAPGEFYSCIAGSRVMVNDGDNVDGYDLLSKVEAIRRDPSKTKDIIQGLPKIEELFEGRRPKDPAILADIEGEVSISEREGLRVITLAGGKSQRKEYTAPYEVRLKVINGDHVKLGAQLTEGSINPHDLLRILGVQAVQTFLVDEIQKIYRGQGVTINDKHIEVIVKQMTRKVRIVLPGDTTLLPGELISVDDLEEINEKTKGEKSEGTDVLLGITKASLSTESFISAASFQETARVLTDAAVRGRADEMYGLKENVIVGRLIPAGTGFPGYRYMELVPETSEASSL